MEFKKGAKILRTQNINITATRIMSAIEWHKSQLPRYEMLKAYYDGEQNILNRTVRVDSNANNKIITNFCNLITNTLTSYFIAKPMEYITENNKTLAQLEILGRLNHEEDHNYEMAKNASMFGHSFEIVYFDENAIPKYERVSPLNTFLLYDIDKNGEVPFGAIRYTEYVDGLTQKKIIRADYYDEQNITSYTFLEGVPAEITEPEPHMFDGVPIIELKNNEGRMGDFEVVLELQDAYNLLMSDRTNNIENNVNALLILKNYSIADTDEAKRLVQTLKARGVLAMDDNGSAEFLSQNIDSTSSKELAESIAKDIHKISCCPDMSDESFSGNTSGVAMKYKMFGADQVVGAKERKFKTLALKRLGLIASAPNTKLNLEDIDVLFDRNTPKNEVELIDAYVKLHGILSDETLLGLFEFLGVNNPKAELEKKLNEATGDSEW